MFDEFLNKKYFFINKSYFNLHDWVQNTEIICPTK